MLNYDPSLIIPTVEYGGKEVSEYNWSSFHDNMGHNSSKIHWIWTRGPNLSYIGVAFKLKVIYNCIDQWKYRQNIIIICLQFHAKIRSGSVLTGLIPPRQQSQVFFFKSRSKSRSRPLGKNISINRKVLSQLKDLCNIKALSLLDQKLWSRLSFFKSRSKVKVKVTR